MAKKPAQPAQPVAEKQVTKHTAEELYQSTLLSLGHPTVKVELTIEQMKNALLLAAVQFELVSCVSKDGHSITESWRESWIEQYAAALMKETLAHIRGKFSSIPVNNESITTDPSHLFHSAFNEKERLLNLLYA